MSAMLRPSAPVHIQVQKIEVQADTTSINTYTKATLREKGWTAAEHGSNFHV